MAALPASGGGGGSSAAELLLVRRYWMPDKTTKSCTGCSAPFTLLRRRHHCRFCGKIFCNACSALGRHFGSDAAVRVCADCRRLDTALASGSGGAPPPPALAASAASSDATLAMAAPAAAGIIATAAGGSAGASAAGPLSGDAPSAPPPQQQHLAASLRSAAAAAGGEFALHSGPGGGGGLGLFDDKSRLAAPGGGAGGGAPWFNLPATAAAACMVAGLAAVCEQHLTACVSRAVAAYISEAAAPAARAVVQAGCDAPPDGGPPEQQRWRQPISGPHDDLGPDLGPNQRAWAGTILRVARRCGALVEPHVSRGDRADIRCYVQVKAVPQEPSEARLWWPRPAAPAGVGDSTSVDAPPAAAAAAGFASCDGCGADWCGGACAGWAAASSPCPAPLVHGVTLGDCAVIDGGVVFRQCLPHKGMRDDIAQPRVLLLNDALTFEGSGGHGSAAGGGGGGGGGARLLSLETLLEQERRYTDILVSKVLAHEPDVLLTSGSVSRLALDLLRVGHVSVVTHVRASTMQRLSRLTGARIVPSINYLDKLPRSELLGSAKRFQVRTLQLPPASSGAGAAGCGGRPAAAAPVAQPVRVTYVVVSGCPEHRGACVLLRGGPGDVRAAKRILRYAIYVARSLRCQAAFMFDAGLEWPARSSAQLHLSSTPARAPFLPGSDVLRQLLLTSLPPGALSPLPAPQVTQLLRWHHALHSSPRLCSNGMLSHLAGGAAVARPPSSGLPLAADGAHASSTGGAGWSRSGALEACEPLARARVAAEADPLPLSAHSESITVATYSLSSEGTQCGARPRLRNIRFFSPSDRSVGQFLEERCLNDRIACRSCHRGPTSHTLSYLHGSMRLDIAVVRASQATAAVLLQQAGAARNTPEDAAPPRGEPSAAEPITLLSPIASASAVEPAGGALDSLVPTLSHLLPVLGTGRSPLPAPHVLPQVFLPTSAAPSTSPLSSSGSGELASGDSISGGGHASSEHITTWAYCPLCRRFVSPPTRLSRSAWNLSFGKLLQLTFYSSEDSREGLRAHSGGSCAHPPFASHVRYFARGRLIAMFRTTSLAPSMVLPPSRCLMSGGVPLRVFGGSMLRARPATTGTETWYARLLRRELDVTEATAAAQARDVIATLQRLRAAIAAAEEIGASMLAVRSAATAFLHPTGASPLPAPSLSAPPHTPVALRLSHSAEDTPVAASHSSSALSGVRDGVDDPFSSSSFDLGTPVAAPADCDVVGTPDTGLEDPSRTRSSLSSQLYGGSGPDTAFNSPLPQFSSPPAVGAGAGHAAVASGAPASQSRGPLKHSSAQARRYTGAGSVRPGRDLGVGAAPGASADVAALLSPSMDPAAALEALARARVEFDSISAGLAIGLSDLTEACSELRLQLASGRRVLMLHAVAPRRGWVLCMRALQAQVEGAPQSAVRACNFIASLAPTILAPEPQLAPVLAAASAAMSSEADASGTLARSTMRAMAACDTPSVVVSTALSFQHLRRGMQELQRHALLPSVLGAVNTVDAGTPSPVGSSAGAAGGLFDVLSGGHLALPTGLLHSVVPVQEHVASTIIAYSLASELYWRKLSETVDTAWERWNDAATTTGASTTDEGDDEDDADDALSGRPVLVISVGAGASGRSEPPQLPAPSTRAPAPVLPVSSSDGDGLLDEDYDHEDDDAAADNEGGEGDDDDEAGDVSMDDEADGEEDDFGGAAEELALGEKNDSFAEPAPQTRPASALQLSSASASLASVDLTATSPSAFGRKLARRAATVSPSTSPVAPYPSVQRTASAQVRAHISITPAMTATVATTRLLHALHSSRQASAQLTRSEASEAVLPPVEAAPVLPTSEPSNVRRSPSLGFFSDQLEFAGSSPQHSPPELTLDLPAPPSVLEALARARSLSSGGAGASEQATSALEVAQVAAQRIVATVTSAQTEEAVGQQSQQASDRHAVRAASRGSFKAASVSGKPSRPRGDSLRTPSIGSITVTDTGTSSASAAAVLSVPLSGAPGASSASRELLPARQSFSDFVRGEPSSTADVRVPLAVSAQQLPPAPLHRPLARVDTIAGDDAPDDASGEVEAARCAANFGVALSLDAELMLQSDVKNDIVHTFTEKSSGWDGPAAAPRKGAAMSATVAGAGASFDASMGEAAPAASLPAAVSPASAATFSLTAYWAMHFHALRELYAGPSLEFVESLAFASRWDASGGKSGARFERTADRRFVVKHVSRTEFDMFVDHIAPAYFQHMRACASAGLPSFLVKVFGAFKVVVAGASTPPAPAGAGGGGGAAPLLSSAAAGAQGMIQLSGAGAGRRITSYAIVMEDLFAGAEIPSGMKFDLKGKLRAQKRPAPQQPPLPQSAASQPTPAASLARPLAAATPLHGDGMAAAPARSGDGAAAHLIVPAMDAPSSAAAPASSTPAALQPAGSGLVLFDGDFLSHTGGHPLPLEEGSKRLLDETLRRDCEFLASVRVIDYSLLVGLNPLSGSVTVGIIDYLRRFDLAKQIESRVKTVTQLVTNVDPTILQPERYASRLQRAVLERYFLAAPVN